MTEGNNTAEGGDEVPSGGPAEEKKPEQESGDSKVTVPEPAAAPALEEVDFVHPEGGWGWLVMLAAMWCNGSVFGIQNAFGILFISLLREFGTEGDDDRFKAGERAALTATRANNRWRRRRFLLEEVRFSSEQLRWGTRALAAQWFLCFSSSLA